MHAGRPREFDRDTALEAMVQVFWERGFESTTKRDLMEATGLASQSLYNTFGGMEQMFQEAMAHYARTRHEQVRQMLQAPGSPLENLRQFVAMWSDLPDEFRRGCLLCNASSQVDPQEPGPLSSFLAEQLMEMHTMFLDSLTAACEAGEIDKSVDIDAIASTLVTAANGVAVQYRVDGPMALIEGTVTGILALLDTLRAASA